MWATTLQIFALCLASFAIGVGVGLLISDVRRKQQ